MPEHNGEQGIDQPQDLESLMGDPSERSQLVEVIFEAYTGLGVLLDLLRSRINVLSITDEERARGEALIGRIEQLNAELGRKAGESDEYTAADLKEITARGSEILSILRSIDDYLAE